MTHDPSGGVGVGERDLDSVELDGRVLRAAVRRLAWNWLWKSAAVLAILAAPLGHTSGISRRVLSVACLGTFAVVLLHVANLWWTHRELGHPERMRRAEIFDSLAMTTKAAGDLEASAAALRCAARARARSQGTPVSEPR